MSLRNTPGSSPGVTLARAWNRLADGLFLGLFGFGLVVDLVVALLERGAQDVAERSTGIGGTILRDRFLLLGDFERLDGDADLVGLAIELGLSLIHISEPTRLGMISYAVFC